MSREYGEKKEIKVMGKIALITSGVLNPCSCMTAGIFLTCILASIFKGTNHH